MVAINGSISEHKQFSDISIPAYFSLRLAPVCKVGLLAKEKFDMAVKLPILLPPKEPWWSTLPEYLKSLSGYFDSVMQIFNSPSFRDLFDRYPRIAVQDTTKVNVLAMNQGLIESFIPLTAKNVNAYKYVAFCKAGVPIVDYCIGFLFYLSFDKEYAPTTLYIKIGKLTEVTHGPGSLKEIR